MSGKATMTVIGNGLAAYDNGAGVRGIVNMATPSTQAMGYTINVSADALGYAQIAKGASDVAQTKGDVGLEASKFGLSITVGLMFGGVPGLVLGGVFDYVAFKDKEGNDLGLLEANSKANLNYAHEFNFVESPYYDNSNTKAPTQTTPGYRGAGYVDPRIGSTPTNAAAKAAVQTHAQAKEIAFAEWTEEQDSDLQALAKVFDSNQDGVFDSQDQRFGEFRFWKDVNRNGVVANHNCFNLVA